MQPGKLVRLNDKLTKDHRALYCTTCGWGLSFEDSEKGKPLPPKLSPRISNWINGGSIVAFVAGDDIKPKLIKLPWVGDATQLSRERAIEVAEIINRDYDAGIGIEAAVAGGEEGEVELTFEGLDSKALGEQLNAWRDEQDPNMLVGSAEAAHGNPDKNSDQGGQTGDGADNANTNDDAAKAAAAEAAAQLETAVAAVNGCENVEQLDALVSGETRDEVLEAAKTKREELAGGGNTPVEIPWEGSADQYATKKKEDQAKLVELANEVNEKYDAGIKPGKPAEVAKALDEWADKVRAEQAE